jgi:glycerol kinase
MRNARKKSGAAGGDIKAIGITNQRETAVVWDKHTGRPLVQRHRVAVHPHRHHLQLLMAEGGQDRFRDKPGCPSPPIFPAPKSSGSWTTCRPPGGAKGAMPFRHHRNLDDLVAHRRPGRGAHVTDVTNASRTLMMNLKTLDWDADILDTLGIPRAMLPRIVPSVDRKPGGIPSASVPWEPRVPVCGALGDQQAALVGQTCFRRRGG